MNDPLPAEFPGNRLLNHRWAWEYIRRNEDLRDDAVHRSDQDISEKKADCADIRILRSCVPQTLAERWGLVFLPDPDLNGFEADAVWSHYVFPDQVEAMMQTESRSVISYLTKPFFDSMHRTFRE